MLCGIFRELLYAERTVCGKVGRALRPSVGIRSNLIFAERNERGAGCIVDEFVDIRTFFELNDKFIFLQGIKTDIVDRDLAELRVFCALDAIEHRSGRAIESGSEDTLPSVDHVICLNGGAVTPVSIVDGDFKIILACLGIFNDLPFLSESLFELAVFVKLGKTFENEAENLNSVLIGIRDRGIEVHYLCTEVNVKFRTFLCGVVTVDLRAAGNESQAHGKREQESQYFLHSVCSSKIIIF